MEIVRFKIRFQASDGRAGQTPKHPDAELDGWNRENYCFGPVGGRRSMVDPQIVVLVVAGSSPVGHPILPCKSFSTTIVETNGCSAASIYCMRAGLHFSIGLCLLALMI